MTLGMVLALGLAAAAAAELPRNADLQLKGAWVTAHLTEAQAALPFSFVYDGRTSAALLAEWPRTVQAEPLDAHRMRLTLRWTEPQTGLEVRCVAVDYADYPAVEWTVWFRNAGTKTLPILEHIQGLDARMERGRDGEFVLHGYRGDGRAADSFAPFQETLGPGATQGFAPAGGRPTNPAWPYYNLQLPGGGVLLAIGWPGQWASAFTRDATNGLRMVAGQAFTRLALAPGEEVRSPLIALVFWEGADRVRAQNLWRRWMLAHNLPRTANDRLPPPQLVACSSLQFQEMTAANEENQKQFIARYQEEGLKPDCWRMDAGWYRCGGDWMNTGSWRPDKTRFPNGLRAVSDYAHQNGVSIITWFEPERVGDRQSWMALNHPEWLLNQAGGPALFNLGDPAARNWMTDHIGRTLTEQGIDGYRQDLNMDPLDEWRRQDALERQGMTENLHVQGYLAFWDALRQRHPMLRIEVCASGGRRNDLETMRRAVPMTGNDFPFEPTSPQSQHRQLAEWLPYHGADYAPGPSATGGQGGGDIDAYAFRAHMAPSLTMCYDMRRKDLNYALARRLCAQMREIAPNFLGDFYPLTAHSLASDAWMAWQYDRPEDGAGMVQAFRRPDAASGADRFRLRGLDPAATYEVRNVDADGATTTSGADLMETGLTVAIAERPGAAVVVYKKVR